MAKEERKEPKKRSITKRIFWIAVLIILVVLAVKFYYVFSLLLGNDYIVTLKTSNESLFLSRGSSENISFQSTMLASPFCSASCAYEFVDLSSGRTLENGSIILKPAISQSKYFEIYAGKLGKGQDIYRFDIRCSGVSGLLCSISDNQRSRSSLVTLNYDLNNEDNSAKESAKARITDLWEENSNLSQKLVFISSLIGSLNTIKINGSENLDSFEEELNDSAGLLLEAKKSWEELDYHHLSSRLDDSSAMISSAEDYFNQLNGSLFDSVNRYNLLISNLTALRNRLEESKRTATNESIGALWSSINSFNLAVESLRINGAIGDKEKRVNDSLAVIMPFNSSENLSVSDLNISDIPKEISMIWNFTPSPSQIELNEPQPVCCLFGKCDACCTGDSCRSKDYPIILLHGHAFNQGISAEYSLETFQKFQDELENEELLNAGSILIGLPDEQRNILSGLNYPVTLRASYYFDIFRGSESSIIQTKSDNLDSYALRLNDIVDAVKSKTGKDKVIIVAHSMGGLVTRKYMQIYGSESLDEVILIATPNKGIAPNILNLCSIIGESLECRDMDENSLFLNKLNYDLRQTVPVYNIIGTGCKTGNSSGDGIVTEEDAYLKNATANYYINGSCDELKLNFLHEKIIDLEIYPSTYDLVRDILKSQ